MVEGNLLIKNHLKAHRKFSVLSLIAGYVKSIQQSFKKKEYFYLDNPIREADNSV
jgi:hypothetical protein